ncbi:5-carboxymethyl-2-hydroxymuconate isomerase [Ornithinibacillus gellani]|uniref:5-carboxymethyl-2-hydroxymuconate Delta-isomerase n=1 Tax=Ornithinibacillus gellani TaxID=2293253 RepID=UPI000F491FA3|nr:5-carboxymethyl-2-hydroxymuconate Delta-isomerase [Ornithinibacillus gellani]TQS74879.1 5-carboxymethyl-2-hydroxymuconate isomerase [Ornithinibacillus gellani]
MPHIIVEYTKNIQEQANIPPLLHKINAQLIAEGDIFPTGGIRSRAVMLQDYVIADSTEAADAFVHVTLKMGSGRSVEVKETVCKHLFHVLESHFHSLLQTDHFALSLELYEFTNPTFKKNTIHARYQKR